MDIGKATPFSVSEKQVVSVRTSSIKAVFLSHFKIPDRHDNAFNTATIAAFKNVLQALKKSFTVDNDKEFAAHIELAKLTGMKVFFCNLYSPWQRRIVEPMKFATMYESFMCSLWHSLKAEDYKSIPPSDITEWGQTV